MSLDAAILRELGASTRTFKTVKGALLWYRDQLGTRLRRGGMREHGSAPRSDEDRQRANATYAAIAACLQGVQHVAWLLAWYETTDGDGAWLATKAELSRWSFTKRCRKTEHELRVKLERTGLLSHDS